jgi:hypothetical protein
MYYKPGNLSALSFPNHFTPVPPDNRSAQKRNLLPDSFTLFLDRPWFPGKIRHTAINDQSTSSLASLQWVAE